MLPTGMREVLHMHLGLHLLPSAHYDLLCGNLKLYLLLLLLLLPLENKKLWRGFRENLLGARVAIKYSSVSLTDVPLANRLQHRERRKLCLERLLRLHLLRADILDSGHLLPMRLQHDCSLCHHWLRHAALLLEEYLEFRGSHIEHLVGRNVLVKLSLEVLANYPIPNLPYDPGLTCLLDHGLRVLHHDSTLLDHGLRVLHHDSTLLHRCLRNTAGLLEEHLQLRGGNIEHLVCWNVLVELALRILA